MLLRVPEQGCGWEWLRWVWGLGEVSLLFLISIVSPELLCPRNSNIVEQSVWKKEIAGGRHAGIDISLEDMGFERLTFDNIHGYLTGVRPFSKNR